MARSYLIWQRNLHQEWACRTQQAKIPGLPPTGSELVDIFAAPNDPSMRENIQAGGPLNYLMAAGQGLGVLGDAMYAAPLVGVALGPTVGTALKGTGMAVKGAAKAAKGIASIPPRAEPKDMVFVHNTSEEAINHFPRKNTTSGFANKKTNTWTRKEFFNTSMILKKPPKLFHTLWTMWLETWSKKLKEAVKAI